MTDYTLDIPLALAIAAHSGTSFTPERRGASVVAEYAETMAADYATFLEQATKGGALDKLDAEFERYRAGCRARELAYLWSSSRCVSSFIAGPSNFPARRMNKRADIASKRLTELCDFRARARSAVIRNLRPDLAPIRTEDADAIERLTIKIARAEVLQTRMKQANAAIRREKKNGAAAQIEALVGLNFPESIARKLLEPDFCGRFGFADFELTNNGANIRRMKAQLDQIAVAKETPTTEIDGANARLEDDPPANRVRLFFPGKPSDDVRSQLKARGFRWSPTIGAWQAYRNWQSIELAKRIAGVPA